MAFSLPTGRNNLGPLTTTFVPPDSCSDYGIAGTAAGGFRAQECAGGTLLDNARCWPSATIAPPAPPLAGWGFYSPGLVCPTGYASACTAYPSGSSPTTTSGPSFSFNYALLPQETAVGCCPSGFTCTRNAGVQSCIQRASATTFEVGRCAGDDLANLRNQTVPQTVTRTDGSESVATTVNLWAPMIQLNFQSSDLAPPTSIPSTSPSSGPSSGPSSTLIDPLPSSLSPGVAAAIAVPVSVVGLALILGFVAFVWRHRRRQLRATPELGGWSVHKDHSTAKPLYPSRSVREKKWEMSGSGDRKSLAKRELEGAPALAAAEAPTGTERSEMGGGGEVHELPATESKKELGSP